MADPDRPGREPRICTCLNWREYVDARSAAILKLADWAAHQASALPRPCVRPMPAVGYRQWVLSFPGPMAVRLGYDAPLLAAIAGRLAQAVMQDMWRSSKQQPGVGRGLARGRAHGRAALPQRPRPRAHGAGGRPSAHPRPRGRGRRRLRQGKLTPAQRKAAEEQARTPARSCYAPSVA